MATKPASLLSPAIPPEATRILTDTKEIVIFPLTLRQVFDALKSAKDSPFGWSSDDPRWDDNLSMAQRAVLVPSLKNATTIIGQSYLHFDRYEDVTADEIGVQQETPTSLLERTKSAVNGTLGAAGTMFNQITNRAQKTDS